MEQKVVITGSEEKINEYIKNGWSVVSVTAQHVAGTMYSVEGNFCFVLERSI